MQEIGQQAVAVYDGFRQSSMPLSIDCERFKGLARVALANSMEVPANDPKIERSFYNLGSFQSI